MINDRCLYLTYDGLLDPLGRSQVLPYLEGLVPKGIEMFVISFEKRQAWRSREKSLYQKRLAQQGIHWIPLRYHKWPPVFSTLFDVFQGMVACGWLCVRKPPRLVHARGYVASLLAWWVKQWTQAKFLFDMRGFWPEERVEGGLSRPNGFLYRVTKWWEKRFFAVADGIVVLSHVAKASLEERRGQNGNPAPVVVIPTCTDLKKFVPHEGLDGAPLRRIVYIGSVGTWYLVREMVQFFQQLLRQIPEAHWTILTPRHESLLFEAVKDLAPSTYEIHMLTHEEVPSVLKMMHASLCFIKPVGSKKASCPTKVGESLACGVPVVMTRGVGDCDTLIEQERVGVVVSNFSLEGYKEAIRKLIALKEEPLLTERCRRVAQKYFDLEWGIHRYFSFYNSLLGGYRNVTPSSKV